MTEKKAMEKGWCFAAQLAGAHCGADQARVYVSKVAEAIAYMESNINNHPYRGQDISRFKGYVLEEWAAGTFNVNAAAASSSDHAQVLHSNDAWSIDVQTDSGRSYSAKAYSTGAGSAKAQAVLNFDTGRAGYDGQYRLVPEDQLADAKATAHREALHNSQIRPHVAEANAETERMLTDVVKNDEGVSSIAKDREGLEDIAKSAKKQEFNAEEHGVSVDTAVNAEYMIEQAFKAGCTAAVITVAMQMAPEIYKAIDYLIKHGEINVEQVKRMGTKAISSGAEGFLRGSVACTIQIMCEKGLLGEALKSVSPGMVGTVVAIVMGTVKNSVLVASGKMTPRQMGAAFVDSVIVSAGFVAGVKIGAVIGGAIGQAIGFKLPVIGYLIGSFIGCAFSVVYNIGKKQLISFCVDSGFTCFGLVEQDYQLPDEMLNAIGIDTIKIPRTEIQRTEVKRSNVAPTVDRIEYETVDITMLRRGVIGVNKIGYVF
jgi:hypothetical protein